MRALVVTACNDLYFPLARGLIRSLRGISFSTSFDLGVLDIGLGEDSKKELAVQGVKTVSARSDIDYSNRETFERQLPGFRAQTAKPFLPSYFPGYDVIMWLDADTWAQTPDAVDTMLRTAEAEAALCIVSEIDRDYRPYFLSSQPWDYHLKWYRACFPSEKVSAIFPRPMLNVGSFAMRSDLPIWAAWADEYRKCLQSVPEVTLQHFMSDQLSLNMAVYTQGLPLRVMPAEFNWMSLYALPMIDSTTRLFVRPTPPRTPISILHLTHQKKMKTLDFATTDGGVLSRTLMNENL